MVIIVFLFIILFMMGGYFYIINHPQIIVGMIQSALYKGKPINSFEPFAKAKSVVKKDGSYYVTEIAYGDKYPNSYLDITYPTQNTSIKRPTVVYFHGGGYFGGDKSMGDPMAVKDDANRLFTEIVANGYNFINVNYALVPEYHFPIPLNQMNQAINYLSVHADEYGLDMSNVIVFGQSAGAILAAQYGALLTDTNYQKSMGIYPILTSKEVKALIIDDAPLNTESFNLKTKLLVGNYLGTMDMKSKIAHEYNAYRYINKDFPPSFMLAGNTDGFPEDMRAFSEKLKECGVAYEYYFIDVETCALPHGYLNLVDKNEYARECFNHILTFMSIYSKE